MDSNIILRDWVNRNARRFPDKEAVICDSVRITFAEFRDRVNRLANTLIDQKGFGKGDRIAILSDNCPTYFELYFGIAQAGMISVPLNYRLSSLEVSELISHSGAKLVFVGPNQVSLLKESPIDIDTVVLDVSDKDKFVFYDDFVKGYAYDEPQVKIKDDDLAVLCYTSGTTGMPKGVMASHRNLVANAINQQSEISTQPEDLVLTGFPMFHIISAIMMTDFARGCSQIFYNFTPEKTLELISVEKPTVLWLPTSALHFTVIHPKVSEYDLSSVRRISTGAGPLMESTLMKTFELFGSHLDYFLHTFAQTEACPILSALYVRGPLSASTLDVSEAEREKLFSSGREVYNVELNVFDENDRPLPARTIGEIVARGRNVMEGYWKDPETTAQALRGGWLHTGDLGYMDEDNFIYLVDRKKDMIISGNENIYSKEVEDVLSIHPAVMDVAVIGVPDDTWGEVVKAIVVLKPGMQVSEQEVIDHCKKRIASYKKPKSVDFWNEPLPRTPSGKVVKYSLREQYWKDHKKKIQ